MESSRSWASYLTVAAVPLGMLAVDSVLAAEYTYNLAYTAEYSDNVRLTPTNEEGELSHIVSAGFALTENSRELEARLQTRAAYRFYQEDTFANDTTLGVNAAAIWKPLPDAFHWTVEDVHTQLLSDATAADTPANRVNTNVLSTGPDLYWRLGAVNTLQLGGRYALTTFDETANTAAAGGGTNSDNARRSATLRWLYRSSPRTTLSLAQAAETVEFDDVVTSATFDFRRTETTVGLASAIARNSFALDLGETRIKRRNQPEIDGTLARLSWRRELTSEASFSLTASRSLSDAAVEVLATASSTAPTTGTTPVSTADIFVSKQAGAVYSVDSGSSSVALSLFYSERVFELEGANNEEAAGGGVEYSYLFTGALSGTAGARYVGSTFPSVPRDDKTVSVSLGLQYRWTRTLSGGLAYGWESRSSTEANAEYTENRIIFNLGYNSIPSRW